MEIIMNKELMKRKRRLFLVTTTPDCPLNLSERLLYSELVFRAKYKRGAKKTQLVKNLKLDAKTVAKHLSGLVNHGLATCNKGEYRAVEPTKSQWSWFRTRRTEKKAWYNLFGYTVLLKPTPSCPLNARQNAIYWLVASLRKNKRKVTKKYVSLLLDLTPQTVKTALQELQFRKLIDSRNQPTELSSWQCDWWEEKPKKAEKSADQEEADIRFVNEELHARFLHLRQHSIPTTLAQEIVKLSSDLSMEQVEFLSLSTKKLEFSNQQKLVGNQQIRHHGRLLRAALKKLLDDRKQVRSVPHNPTTFDNLDSANFEEPKVYGERDILCAFDLRPQEGYTLFNDICRIVYRALSSHKNSDPLSVVSKLIEESLQDAATAEDFKERINHASVRRGLPEVFVTATV